MQGSMQEEQLETKKARDEAGTLLRRLEVTMGPGLAADAATRDPNVPKAFLDHPSAGGDAAGGDFSSPGATKDVTATGETQESGEHQAGGPKGGRSQSPRTACGEADPVLPTAGPQGVKRGGAKGDKCVLM